MFNNAIVFRLDVPWNTSSSDIDSAVNHSRFVNCSSLESQRSGWVSPVDAGDHLVHSVGEHLLLKLCTEQRILPAKVVKEQVAARAERVAGEQSYPVGRRQLREIKNQVIDELLPRAFTRKQYIFVWIDPKDGWLIVDTSARAKAEEVVGILLKDLGNAPIRPVRTTLPPTSAMANWLASGEAPSGFSIDQECVLTDTTSGKASVRYVRHPLEGAGIDDEIKAHLARGKVPVKLALTWQERLSFVLTEQFEIKKIQLLDISDVANTKSAENKQERFDSDFALLAGELQGLLKLLVEALGGEPKL